MVQRGVLGKLKYDDSDHGWTTHVGDCLTRMQMLAFAIAKGEEPSQRPPLDGLKQLLKSPEEELDYIVDVLGMDLEQHRIRFRPGDELFHNPWQTFDSVVEKIYERHGELHEAFTLIANAHTYLQFNTSPTDGKFYEVARNVLAKVDKSKNLLHDKRGLVEVLSRENNLAQSSRDLLQRLAGPLIILLVLADPATELRLRFLEEKRALGESLRATAFADSFVIEDLPSCRLQDFEPGLVRYRPQIVHFSGHGSRKGLVIGDIVGNSQDWNLQLLTSMLASAKQYGLDGVVLNACDSVTQAKPIADVVGRVIAMQGPITDSAAIAFTTSFYQGLGEGLSLDEAFSFGVQGCMSSAGGDKAKPRLILKSS